MDNRRPKKMADLNVREAERFLEGYHESQIHGLQQILGWFGESPKLERILFAYLKKGHIETVKKAEELTRRHLIRRAIDPYDSEISPAHKCREEQLEEVRALREKAIPGYRIPHDEIILTDEWLEELGTALDKHLPKHKHLADEAKKDAAKNEYAKALDTAIEAMELLKKESDKIGGECKEDAIATDIKKKEKPSDLTEPFFREPDELPFVVGVCPRPDCDGLVKGLPLPPCEERKSGRSFYKECVQCSYYAEIVKKRHKYKEFEGGE